MPGPQQTTSHHRFFMEKDRGSPPSCQKAMRMVCMWFPCVCEAFGEFVKLFGCWRKRVPTGEGCVLLFDINRFPFS